MGRAARSEVGWGPLLGSYEEAVLSWHEQVEKAFAESRHRDLAPGSAEPRGDQVQAGGPVTRLRAGERLP